MKDPRPTLTLSRLEQLLDAYGGEPAAWPELERAAALALIEQDVQARGMHEQALALDAKLELSELSDVVSSRNSTQRRVPRRRSTCAPRSSSAATKPACSS